MQFVRGPVRNGGGVRPLNSSVSHHMREAAELAGFFTAHAVWSISDGETLVPIYAYVDSSGERAMERIAAPRLEESVQIGQQRLSENPHNASVGVLVYDGRITVEGRKLDSLIVQFRDFGQGASAVMAIPYKPKKLLQRFVVYRPKLLEAPENSEAVLPEVTEAFFRGVDNHEKGAAVWSKHSGESM